MRTQGAILAATIAALGAGCGDDAPADGTGGAGGVSATTTSTAATTTTGGAGGDDAPADCSGTPTEDERLAAALDVLRHRVEEDGAPGGALAIVQNGEIVGLGVVGSKEKDGCDPITPDTLFNVGFQSVALTHLAVLDAVEDGLLDLDAPITDYIPELEDQVEVGDPGDITLRHLLGHTGMLRSDADRIQDVAVCGELVDAVGANAVIQATPGSMHDHNDRSNPELAGLALEKVDGRPFAESVAARVLAPLGMGGAYEGDALEESDHAQGHENGIAVASRPECRNRFPSHGYHGSIHDQARLLAYLAGGPGDVLGEAMRAELLEAHGPHFFSDSFTSFGLQGFYPSDIDDDIYWSDSYSYGFTETLHYLGRRGLGVIVLMNKKEAQPWAAALEILTLYDATAIVPVEFLYTPDEDELEAYLGVYTDDVGFDGGTSRTVTITRSEDPGSVLTAVLTNDGAAPLDVPVSPGCCVDNFLLDLGENAPGHARFWRDDAGNVEAIQVWQDNGPPFFRSEDP
jgi:CubicO group peptidase (beta-lactamase class C family)